MLGKRFIWLSIIFLVGTTALAVPPGHIGPRPGGMGRPPMNTIGRPPMHSPGRPPMHHPGINPRPPVSMTPVKRPPIHNVVHRPPMPRPYHYRPLVYPVYRPYYYRTYPVVYSTSYSYYPYEAVYISGDENGKVIIRENPVYAGVNTAANVINAAANTAAAIRFLTW